MARRTRIDALVGACVLVTSLASAVPAVASVSPAAGHRADTQAPATALPAAAAERRAGTRTPVAAVPTATLASGYQTAFTSLPLYGPGRPMLAIGPVGEV